MATAAIVKANSLLLSKRNESPHINLFYNNSVKFSRCFNVRLNTWTLGATSKNKIVAPSTKKGNEIAAVPSSEQNLKAQMSDSLHSRSDCVISRCDCFYCISRNAEIKGKAEGEAIGFALVAAVGVVYTVGKIQEGTKACLFKIKRLFDHLVMKLKQLCGIVSPVDETLTETIETIPEGHVESNSNEEDNHHKAMELLIAELERSDDLIRELLLVYKSKIITSNVTHDKSSKFSCQKRRKRED